MVPLQHSGGLPVGYVEEGFTSKLYKKVDSRSGYKVFGFWGGLWLIFCFSA